MADITRDDLRRVVRGRTYKGVEYVTDEEFDRLAGERTAELLDDPSVRSDLLRALLTDECEPCKGTGQFLTYGVPCTDCDGHGWVPKDGTVKTHGGLHLSFPRAWLEDDDGS